MKNKNENLILTSLFFDKTAAYWWSIGRLHQQRKTRKDIAEPMQIICLYWQILGGKGRGNHAEKFKTRNLIQKKMGIIEKKKQHTQRTKISFCHLSYKKQYYTHRLLLLFFLNNMLWVLKNHTKLDCIFQVKIFRN